MSLFLLIPCYLKSQESKYVLDEKIKYEIKRQLIKRHDLLQGLTYCEKWSENEMLSFRDWKNTRFIGFGFLPVFPEMKTVPYDIKCKGLSFYLSSFDFNQKNNSELYGTIQAKNIGLSSKRNAGLTALNDEGKIVFIIYNDNKNKNIARFFQLSSRKKGSYIPFIEAQLFGYPYEKEIKYLEKSKDTLIFQVTFRMQMGWRTIFHFFIPIDDPDAFQYKEIKRYQITSVIDSNIIENNPPSLNEPIQLKSRDKYLKWALMSNLYLKLMDRKVDELDIEYSYNSPYLDSLLPNYDQILPRLELFKYGCCWIDNQSRHELLSKLPYGIKFIYRHYNHQWPINYKIVVGEKRRSYPHIEYYKMILDTSLYLEGVRDHQFKGNYKEYSKAKPMKSYDSFYSQKAYYKTKTGEIELIPPPAPMLRYQDEYSLAKIISACTNGYNFDTVRNHYDIAYSNIVRPVNHYLIALDTRTRDVYFLSGKDIFLTKSTPLYMQGIYNRIENFFMINHEPGEKEWNEFLTSKEFFTYLQDRLYRYLVERLDEDNIVYKDEEKMVLRCQGEEYKKPLELEVIFYYDNPEELEVKVLDE
jgi:hypothetical protein